MIIPRILLEKYISVSKLVLPNAPIWPVSFVRWKAFFVYVSGKPLLNLNFLVTEEMNGANDIDIGRLRLPRQIQFID